MTEGLISSASTEPSTAALGRVRDILLSLSGYGQHVGGNGGDDGGDVGAVMHATAADAGDSQPRNPTNTGNDCQLEHDMLSTVASTKRMLIPDA